MLKPYILKIKSLPVANITRVVVFAGILIVIGIFIVAYQAYSSSREAMLQTVYSNNMLLAQTFRDFARAQGDSVNSKRVLNGFRDLWKNIEHPYKGGFLCVIDEKGRLTLHTAAPNREGVFVGENPIHPDSQTTLHDLVESEIDYVGPYLSSAGKDQVAAFSYVQPLKSVVSIHVPFEEIEAQITQTVLPWIIGMLVIGTAMFPALLWFLHRAFIASQDNLKQVNVALVGEVQERKQAEMELEKHRFQLEKLVEDRTTELRNTNQELESFCYSVSHDLRSPLRSIDGFSHILIDDYADSMDSDAQDYLDRIRLSVQRMGALIDDLLKLSHVNRGDLHYRKIDMTNLIKSIVDEFQMREQARQYDVDIQEGLTAYADENLLKIAFENLLGNAWKYTDKTKHANITIGSQVMDGELVYFVKDNGIGFDMQYVDKLFIPFQRLHADHDFPGTGIGLATVYRIINRHGGRIWAEGEPGAGAAFYFTLPASDEEKQDAS